MCNSIFRLNDNGIPQNFNAYSKRLEEKRRSPNLKIQNYYVLPVPRQVLQDFSKPPERMPERYIPKNAKKKSKNKKEKS